jgi:membrane protease YdiL (CAAX protease family)
MSSENTAAPADKRPWGLWASLIWYLIIFEGVERLFDYALNRTGLQAIADHNQVLSGLRAFIAWGLQFLVLVLAVRMTGIPLRDYLAWRRPRVGYIAIGIAIVVAIYALLAALTVAAGGGPGVVADYRSAMAGGGSPWWFVLRWWPSFILAPFVEESFFRGFLWRGVEFRLGSGAAFAVTTLVFAAIHYDYWAAGGVIDPPSVVQYLLFSALFGWLRWRSGSTIVTMIVHCADNLLLSVMVVAMSALLP